MTQVIPVVLASDYNYLPFVYVVIYSILKNRKSSYGLSFYVMVPQGTDRVNYDKDWGFDRYEVNYIQIPDNIFSDIRMTIAHITKPTYYRLLIPDYLKDLKKCIYLDADTLVFKDIYELFHTEISDVYLAAGLGVDAEFTESNERKLSKYLGIPSARYYFNAGVLVMNLEKMREDNIKDTFLECSKEKWTCQDQDVLNICCYGQVKILPLKYNVYSLGYGYGSESLKARFSEAEIEEGLEAPVILHYATEQTKPWRNIKAIKAQIWWQMAWEALPESAYLMLRQQAEEQTRTYKISDLIPKFILYRNTIIFGCGKMGKQLLPILEEREPGKVIGFWDNDPKHAGTTYQNIPIGLPERRKGNDLLIVISCQQDIDNIKKQLGELGFRDREIATYKLWSLDSWTRTDVKYRDEIIRNIKEDIYLGKKE
nr:glycosyltransferase [uncultured Acetatifactor sp.]